MSSPDPLPLFCSGYSRAWLGIIWLWASPATFLGLMIGAGGLASRGRVQRVGHTLEFHGGFVTWLLEHTPIDAAGMTLGHVILGRSAVALDFVRPHEWVHVRQYERWGPMFLPAYLTCSLLLLIQGKDAYRDNPFEIEAYAADEQRLLAARSTHSPDSH